MTPTRLSSWLRRHAPTSLSDRFTLSVTALTAVLVLALATVSWASLSRAKREARRAIDAGLTREIAAHLSGELHNVFGTLDEIASNRLLTSALGDSEGRDAYLRPFLGSIRSVGDVPTRVALCDFSGRPILTNGLDAPALPPPPVPAVVAAREPRAVVVGVGTSAELVLAFPVIFPGTRRPEGLLVASAGVADLFEHTLATHSVGAHSVVTSGTRVVFESGEPPPGGAATAEAPVELPPPLAALDLRIRVSRSDVAAPADLAALFALLALVSVAAFAALARVVAARLTRPVAGLPKVAEEISHTGLLLALPEAEGEDEAARLSRAFARMIARVREAQESLADGVRERTADLERANAGLRREMEERRRVERSAERVFESVGQGLAVLDRGFAIQAANGAFAALAGKQREEVVGRRCHEVLFGRAAPCDAHGEPCPAAWVAATGTAGTGELVVRGRVLETRCFPLKDEAGEVDAVIYALADVTERRALAEQVREAQKMEAVGHLAGGVAHDFNNIVAAVMGNAAVLRDELANDPTHLELVDEILGASRRARELTGQLLAFGRKQPLRRRPLDPGAVVEGVRPMVRALLPEDVELRVERGEDVPAVLADRGQLEQVIVNLAANARDAMPAGGTLTITIRRAAQAEAAPWGSAAVISVADTGVGMDAATRARVFEPFFTTKAAGKGTGLGLAVVYGIVTKHGGRLKVESRPGHGSCFDVVLPGTSAPPEELAASASAAAPRGEGETILIAEDEPRIRRLFRRVLEGHGYRVVEASDGREALAVLRDSGREISLALLDVVMPGANGPEVLDEARRLRPGLRAVMVSGYAEEAHESRGGLDPLVPLVAKPCLPVDLLGAIRQALDE